MKGESFDPEFASLYEAGELVWSDGFVLAGLNAALPYEIRRRW